MKIKPTKVSKVTVGVTKGNDFYSVFKLIFINNRDSQ